MRTWKKPVWARNFFWGRESVAFAAGTHQLLSRHPSGRCCTAKRIKVTRTVCGSPDWSFFFPCSTHYIHFHQKLFLQDLVLVFRDCYSRSRSFHTVMTLESVDPMMLSKPLSAFTSALSNLPRHQAQKSPRSTGTR